MFGSIKRGTRNAFRNTIRTGAVAAILGVSLGIVVVMLAARGAVSQRIIQVKANIGSTVTISPAGARGFLGGGEPLTQSQIALVAAVSHVTAVDATIDAQMRNGDDTTLQSAIELGTLGGRGFRAFRGQGTGPNGAGGDITNQQLANFTPPIFAVGTNNAQSAGAQIGQNLKLTNGQMFDPVSDANEAVMGKNLADKNSLAVGSTFTAYGQTVTVVGLYDAGNQFANNSVVFPLTTLQRLSGQTDQITAATAQVDSVENLASATSTIKTKLGDAADVTSSEDTVKNSVAPLENIITIATTSLIGALIASAVITLLTMVMIVRERRKEIAVLKAIGAGDGSIVTQFMFEAIALSILGSVIGTVLGIMFSNPILKALLTSTRDTGGPATGMFEGPGRGAAQFAVGGFRAAQGAVQNLQAVVDWHLIVYGILAAIGIAIIDSVFPAWLIGKVRPAEVLRSE